MSLSKNILFIPLITWSACVALAADGPASSDAEIAPQMQALRDAMTLLEARRAQLEQDMNELRARLVAGSETAPSETIPAPPLSVAVEQPAKSAEAPAPLFIRIGSAEFTPGGF